MASEKQPTVIKKYANRRLYHTGTSSYVTLEDLATLVRAGEDFLVYDAKSGDDITRSVLAQIIFEEENKDGQNLLPINFLRQLIRFYGDSMQAVVPRYLEFSLEHLMKEQSQFREQVAKSLGLTAAQALEQQAQANIRMFMDAFRLFNPFAAAREEEKRKAAEAAGSGGGSGIDDLKAELSAMRERLDRLSNKS